MTNVRDEDPLILLRPSSGDIRIAIEWVKDGIEYTESASLVEGVTFALGMFEGLHDGLPYMNRTQFRQVEHMAQVLESQALRMRQALELAQTAETEQ